MKNDLTRGALAVMQTHKVNSACIVISVLCFTLACKIHMLNLIDKFLIQETIQ
jgi:hypothetical protein